jgi:hypothetical protein
MCVFVIYVYIYIVLYIIVHLFLIRGLEHCLFSHSVGNVIIPTDELIIIFFRGVGIPPTRVHVQLPMEVPQ